MGRKFSQNIGDPARNNPVGHGRSEGERVQVSDAGCYVRDVFQHIDQVTAINTGIPVFIFGHSMVRQCTALQLLIFFFRTVNKLPHFSTFQGGSIAIVSVIERPDFFAGAIFSAANVIVDPAVATTCTVFLAKIAAWIAPSYQVLPPIDPSLMSRDTEQVKKFANDPLNWHGGRKARWANAMLEALDKIQGKISTIKTPFLVANGDADQLTKMDSPRFLYENAPSSDKTFKVYKDCRHELLNELEESAEMFVKDILDWIKQRLP
ncbi:monoglyceride lipase-like isoform X3 [Oculina patagonica]